MELISLTCLAIVVLTVVIILRAWESPTERPYNWIINLRPEYLSLYREEDVEWIRRHYRLSVEGRVPTEV